MLRALILFLAKYCEDQERDENGCWTAAALRDSIERRVGKDFTVGQDELDQVNAHLAPHLTDKIQFLAQGNESTVYDLGGDKIAKVGYGEPPVHPDVPELLKPISQAYVTGDGTQYRGGLRVEVYPKADTSNITPKDITKMTEKLASRGYTWDSANGNLGRVGGKLRVIDSGGLLRVRGAHA